MLLFVLLGIILGFIISILIIVILLFFKKTIENKIEITGKKISNMNRPKGFIVPSMTENEEFRENVLKKNRKLGIDTPIKDLL